MVKVINKLSTYLPTKYKQMFDKSPFNGTCFVLSYHQGISNKCFCWEGIHMSNEERKQCIIDMIRRIDDEALLRRIYLILVVMIGADE